MANIIGVQKFYCFQNLFEDQLCISFRIVPKVLDNFKHFNTINSFHYDMNLPSLLKALLPINIYFIHANDIWMR